MERRAAKQKQPGVGPAVTRDVGPELLALLAQADHHIDAGDLVAGRSRGHLADDFLGARNVDQFVVAFDKEMVVRGAEILERLRAQFDLRPVASDNPSSTSKRWAFADGRGEIGIIAPVSEPFCGHCNRIRMTADDKIRTCLFSVTEHDLRARLREGASDENIADWLRAVVWQKEARHHIGEPDFVPASRSMSCIGG